MGFTGWPKCYVVLKAKDRCSEKLSEIWGLLVGPSARLC